MNELRHSALNRGVMLDWLRHCADTGAPFPSDEAIQERFGFHSVEQARTLLADLSDRGEISIRHMAGRREIVIGKAAPVRPGLSPGRIARSVVKPDAEVERTVKRIMAIVRSDKPAARPKLTVAPPPSRAVPPGRGMAPPIAPAARPNPARETKPMPVEAKRQVNMRVSIGHYDRLAAMAEAEETSMTAVATRILEEALDGEGRMKAPPPEPAMVPLDGKPLVRVAVLRAAEAIGMDLHHFCSRLLDLGLECWNGQREAAE